MAVLQMQRISICALKKNRKSILETLQRRGVVELSDLAAEDSVFQKSDTAQTRAQFDKVAATARQALEILEEYVPASSGILGMFAGREAISELDYDRLSEKREEIAETAYQLTAFSKSVAESRAELLKLQTQLDALAPWMGLDVSLRFTGTRTTSAFIGSFSEPLSEEAILLKLAELAPNLNAVNVDIVSESREQTCVFILVPRGDAEKADEALRAMGFIRPASPPKQPPAERRKILEERMENAEKAVSDAENQIKACADKRSDLKFLSDYYAMRLEKYEAINKLVESKSTFLLSGYTPDRTAAALEQELTSRFDAAVELAEPGEDEDVPCLLHNNKFTEPVEGVLESYGLPVRGEIDPTPFMAVFYYFLFGLMFSDFAYGAILAIGAWVILTKFKNMEEGTSKMVRMFGYCGVSTALWGIVFSSYFGDVVNVVSRTFFGHEVGIPALWFAPLDDPMKMLVFSMAVGVVHLFFGLGIQLYQRLHNRDYKGALFNVGFWYMLVGGLIVFGLSTQMLANILQLDFTLPAAVGSVAGWIAAVGAVGIVLTNGEGSNPVIRFLQGLYQLYNVTGYLSDILSYSRLLALGLATGVVGSVINQMGSMAGGGIPGIILFVLVFLVGHTINFGIELLGAYVHTNRLQYVEFFGKFYEGGSRKFDPLAVHTKYYKFKEEN